MGVTKSRTELSDWAHMLLIQRADVLLKIIQSNSTINSVSKTFNGFKGGFRMNRHEADGGPVAKDNSVGRELLFHQPCRGVAWLLPTKGLMTFRMELALDRRWDSWGSPESCIRVTESGLSTKLFCKQIFKLCPWARLLSENRITIHWKCHQYNTENKNLFICLNKQLHNSLSATERAKWASSKQSQTFLGNYWGMPQIQNCNYNWVFWGGLGGVAIFPPYLKKSKRKMHPTFNSMSQSKQNCKTSVAHVKS